MLNPSSEIRSFCEKKSLLDLLKRVTVHVLSTMPISSKPINLYPAGHSSSLLDSNSLLCHVASTASVCPSGRIHSVGSNRRDWDQGDSVHLHFPGVPPLSYVTLCLQSTHLLLPKSSILGNFSHLILIYIVYFCFLLQENFYDSFQNRLSNLRKLFTGIHYPENMALQSGQRNTHRDHFSTSQIQNNYKDIRIQIIPPSIDSITLTSWSFFLFWLISKNNFLI